MRVAGVDGCRGGWLVARVVTPPGGGLPQVTLEVTGDLEAIVAEVRRGELRALGLDMPIGLPESGIRLADREARRLLGPRRSSLFPTPPRAALAATDYADALARCRAVDGRGLSRQAFNLLAPMRQVAAAVEASDQPAVSEVHPETTFAVLGDGPCRNPKHSPAGQAERTARLCPHYGDVGGLVAGRPPGAGIADVLDALAAAVTAGRIATGRARWLGDPAARDAAGRRCTIAV